MYNKIFTKILDSSIWLEPDATRIVWLTCIAAMDEDGFCCFASPANLAHRANVPLAACLTALETLEGPDENSSDPANDGRRLERVPGGWMVLNASKYREIITRASQREHTKLRVKRHRDRRNAPVTAPALQIVTCNASEALADADTEIPPTPHAIARGPDRRIPREIRKQAERIRNASFSGCTHEVPCGSYRACVDLIARALLERAS